MSKILVAYFSATGTTAQTAKHLAAAAGADLYEIRPAKPYTEADLNWTNNHSRCMVEMNNRMYRPPLADKDANIAAYDKILLGFPIWFYVAPTIINTFLESYNFYGKTIILFTTSGGNGFGKTTELLVRSCPGAIVREGRILNGSFSASALKQWVSSL